MLLLLFYSVLLLYLKTLNRGEQKQRFSNQSKLFFDHEGPCVSCIIFHYLYILEKSQTFVSSYPDCCVFTRKLCHHKFSCVIHAFKRTFLQTFVRSGLLVRSSRAHKWVCSDSRALLSRLVSVLILIACTQQLYNVFISSIDIIGVVLIKGGVVII